jgi:hypothetical protein
MPMSDPSDPLSIPDDKRAGSGRVRLFDTPERSWFLWIIVPVVAIWFDYYHPQGVLFDIIFVIALVVAWSRHKR